MSEVKFTDLFTGKPRTIEEVAEARLEVCKSCEHFIKATAQCKKCGCLMKLKTKLSLATCPEGKW